MLQHIHTISHDRRLYLVILDHSPEFMKALRFAIRMAIVAGGHVGILHVLDEDDVQSWGKIEARLKLEVRQMAEKKIWDVAKIINDTCSQLPVIFIEEGDRRKSVVDVANNVDNGVGMLILGASSSARGGGPLVRHMSGGGFNDLKVPVVLVPEHLDDIWIDGI